MKQLTALQQGRRSNSFRGSSPLDSTVDGGGKSFVGIFWLVIHGVCCLISLVLGFRFSRLVFFLLFSNSNSNYSSSSSMLFHDSGIDDVPVQTRLTSLSGQLDKNLSVGLTGSSSSRVVVGRHGILIRPWPHPNASEVMQAHKIMEIVQREQRLQYGVKNPRDVIVVTPTYVRTFQTLHLTGVMHSLMNVPYNVVWIVVEAGGATNETASLMAKSGLKTVHIGLREKMPVLWEDRHKFEAKMRLRALRYVREEKLDGIVMFADDSNMHSLEVFDEIQKVKWIGALSVGILAHSGGAEEEISMVQKEEDRNLQLPIQGPACNSSDHFVGWHTFDSSPYAEKSARYIGDRAVVLPRKIEWAGFVLNSRLVWNDAEARPEWVKDLDDVMGDRVDVESPLSLLKHPSMVEPLGSCGRKVMLWWLRVEARADSKFPARWIIDPPLDVTVPAKRTPWPDAPPELPSGEKLVTVQEHTEKRPPKTRSRKRSSRGKRKHIPKNLDDRHTTRLPVEN
ncbi:putative beta-1,4-xylosyltransferase IRX14H [Capsicum annuum]|uniref:Glycosyltransferases n=1 Tax=Capsicum annuum TaxID=4072 RepID=A0A1U8EU41_CAPAN|nr:beta-1,4-xylosyltransferase IRX14 [Capsicum annuum]KAF3643532.1 putative beta-1,4-xylosyltransferase IRX14H [Capsicum annuum]PHT64851.1 putative beta-1,4-xylosyltransferase IRX14H [Capsicum annuum]